MESLKKSVSDGKSAIASAITEKGVSTESDATFETLANNISNIQIMTEELVNQNYELYTCYVVNDSGTLTSHNSYNRGVTFTCPYYGKVEITMNNNYMGDETVRTVVINGVTKYYSRNIGSNQLTYDVSKGDVLYTCVIGTNTGSNPKSYAHIVHFSGFKEK